MNAPTLGNLAELADFALGRLRISPARRIAEGPSGSVHLQPQVMLVLLHLARQPGRVVTRRALFDSCWGAAAVGDDSLNRVLSAIRQMIDATGGTDVAIETVPRTGYRLTVAPVAESTVDKGLADAIEAAMDCWRAGLPKPDLPEIATLEAALASTGGTASCHGALALLLRKAAEYGEAEDTAAFVKRCEQASRRALALDPQDANARVALIGVQPLFGNWTAARAGLSVLLDQSPGHAPTLHDLAVLEMATGRPRRAAEIVAGLIDRDPLAATYQYKRLYQLWTLGDFNQAERAAMQALSLWPRHPAIWMARFWTLLFTDRAAQAARMAEAEIGQGLFPGGLVQFLLRTARLVAEPRGDDGRDHVGLARDLASRGPANAVAALLALCALDAIDDAFAVARGYYLGEGNGATPVRPSSGDPLITDQHRRLTQPLFIPAARTMRGDPRFAQLCDDIGLSAYWQELGIAPDFRCAESAAQASATARL